MLSYALRHNPSKYNLEVDGEGWTSIKKLLIALPSDHYNNDNRTIDHIITRQDIEEMIACSNKVCFELRDDKIRALYGHSNTFTKINKIPSKPPAILYHGTTPSAIKRIMSEGLRPMNRQYVQLSIDENTAIQVGKRKIKSYTKETPVIISVSAFEAYNTQVSHFYQATKLVWLADYIHPNFMELKNP
jgi:putative RNA 2'-phosphotransferase